MKTILSSHGLTSSFERTREKIRASWPPVIVKNNKTAKSPTFLTSFNGRWMPEQFHKVSSGLIDDRMLRSIYIRRNVSYKKWLNSWGLPEFNQRWLPVRIVTDSNDNAHGARDFWYRQFVEGVFFVYDRPITQYDETNVPHQFYLLSPECTYLVNRILLERNNIAVPKRDEFDEFFLPREIALQAPRFIPTKVASHLANETVGGLVPFIAQETLSKEASAPLRKL